MKIGNVYSSIKDNDSALLYYVLGLEVKIKNEGEVYYLTCKI